MSFLNNLLGAKRLQLLRELVPPAAVIGLLVNPTNPSFESETRDLQDAARVLGLRIQVQNASSERDIDSAFANFAQQRVNALVVGTDAFFLNRRPQFAVLAARYSLPAIFSNRAYAEAGGLMSYGASITHAYHLAGLYAGQILNGAKPADLPVVQSTKFELVINLSTARALGLDVPSSFYWRADEVIE